MSLPMSNWMLNKAGRHGNDRVDLKAATETLKMDRSSVHSRSCSYEYNAVEYNESDKTDTQYIRQIVHTYMHREWRGYYNTLHQPAWHVCEFWQEPIKNPDYEELRVK